jgi:hypothetical protein
LSQLRRSVNGQQVVAHWLIVLVALFEFDTLIGLPGFVELIANTGDSMNSMNQLNSIDFPLPEGFW